MDGSVSGLPAALKIHFKIRVTILGYFVKDSYPIRIFIHIWVQTKDKNYKDISGTGAIYFLIKEFLHHTGTGIPVPVLKTSATSL